MTGTSIFARTEIHPPTALAWIHALAGQPGHYQLSWRMSSHATFPRDQPQQFRGTLHARIPLPDSYSGPVVLESQTTCDYLFTDWDIDGLDSCKFVVSQYPFYCSVTIAILEYFKSALPFEVVAAIMLSDWDGTNAFFNACRGHRNAQLERLAGSCSQWKSQFSAEITATDTPARPVETAGADPGPAGSAGTAATRSAQDLMPGKLPKTSTMTRLLTTVSRRTSQARGYALTGTANADHRGLLAGGAGLGAGSGRKPPFHQPQVAMVETSQLLSLQVQPSVASLPHGCHLPDSC
jgi:hypothetical protein